MANGSGADAWLPTWLLKFVAGAFLMGSLAWGTAIEHSTIAARDRQDVVSDKVSSLSAKSEADSKALDLVRDQLNRMDAKIDYLVEQRTKP